MREAKIQTCSLHLKRKVAPFEFGYYFQEISQQYIYILTNRIVSEPIAKYVCDIYVCMRQRIFV